MKFQSYSIMHTALGRILTVTVIVAAWLLAGKSARAQQFFSYSQYMNNPAPINHAYSLLDGNGSITGLFRKQWVGI